MSADPRSPAKGEGKGTAFATTDWSAVLAAQQTSLPGAEDALEDLCRTYWYPLYAYVRSRGYRPEEAQDLTQEFFARLIARKFLQSVDREKGRFRSFLLACMKHLLADEWDKAHTLKRGGHVRFLSWDVGVAEAQVKTDLDLTPNPETLFARQWALAVLETVKARVQAYYAAADREHVYEAVYPYLRGDDGQPTYAEIGDRLGMTAAAVEITVRRMRRRYSLWLREEIARTVCDAADIDDELRFLRQSLAS